MRRIIALVAFLALAHAGELHEAARKCDMPRLRRLLSNHPALNETDENGLTPLNTAIDLSKTECVALLLEAGADPRALDRQGRNAYDAAFRLRDLEPRKAITALLRNSPRAKSPEQPMPWSLEYAAKRGQANVTNMLLSLGVDPNAIGTSGTTPLADAALKGDLASVRALLTHGARVNVTSSAGTQPIHDAALGDSAEVIRELVSHGADKNARTREEAQTPLHVAAAMGKMKAVEALVALGADLLAKDSKGRTPLAVADRAGLADVAAFLRRAATVKAH